MSGSRGTVSYTSAFPGFNPPDRLAIRNEDKVASRVDTQVSQSQRLMFRGTLWNYDNPRQSGGGANANPNTDRVLKQKTDQLWASWTSVMGSRMINEVGAGVSYLKWLSEARTPMSGPAITLQGYSFGLGSNGTIGGCCLLTQTVPSVVDRFTYTNGGHTLKVGAEFLRPRGRVVYDGQTIGTLDARGGPIPANIVNILPSNDPATWNLSALAPIALSYSFWAGRYDQYNSEPTVSSWVQDDWQVTPRLTLNLGLRYDLFYNGMAQQIEILQIKHKGSQDWRNFGPRGGFAYALNEGTDRHSWWDRQVLCVATRPGTPPHARQSHQYSGGHSQRWAAQLPGRPFQSSEWRSCADTGGSGGRSEPGDEQQCHGRRFS